MCETEEIVEVNRIRLLELKQVRYRYRYRYVCGYLFRCSIHCIFQAVILVITGKLGIKQKLLIICLYIIVNK